MATKKLAAHVALYDDEGVLHQLRPGDSVPGWAKDRIGKHALEGDEDTDPIVAASDAAREDIDPDGENDLTPAANIDILGDPNRTPLATPSEDAEGNRLGDKDVKASTKSEAKGAGAPDFTKPAARRGSKNTEK